MLTIDRKKSPDFRTIDKINFIKAGEKKLSNGIPVYIVNTGTQDFVKIEFLFSAGIKYQDRPLVAATANNTIAEGTSKYTASELADKIDYYGAFFETDIDSDCASVNLYTLNKHLNNTLPFIEEAIKNPVFPEEELAIYLDNKKSKFLVNSKKVNNVARKKFNELLFDEKHPYGYSLKAEDYDNVQRNEVADFYKKYYSSDNCMIIVSGKMKDNTLDLLEKYFGGNDWKKGTKAVYTAVTPVSALVKKNMVYKEEAVQSAIRIGKLLFNKTHPDYPAMQVLNTVLGGYFGSRLMNNIREDKGYTYGISSALVPFQHSGYFYIATEVGVEVCEKAIDEIFFEIRRLQEELVDEKELHLVKNYMLGAFLRSLDGPFALATKLKSIMEYGLGYDYFDNFISTIKNISAVELRNLANKYLQRETMYELVVGKRL